MGALILAPDHDPFAFLNCNPHYRTAAKGLCVPLRNALTTAPCTQRIPSSPQARDSGKRNTLRRLGLPIADA